MVGRAAAGVTVLLLVAGSLLIGTAAVSAGPTDRPGSVGTESNETAQNRSVWQRAYFAPVGAAGNQTLFGADRTDDGFLLVGSGESYVGTDDGDVDSFVVETDAAGRVVWERSYSTYGTHNRVFYDAAKVGTQRYLYAGTVDGPRRSPSAPAGCSRPTGR